MNILNKNENGIYSDARCPYNAILCFCILHQPFSWVCKCVVILYAQTWIDLNANANVHEFW